MIRWRILPSAVKEDVIIHSGLASTCSESGLHTKLCRAAEYAVHCSNLVLVPKLEWVRCVYVGVDWSAKGFTAELTPMDVRFAWVMFRCCYSGTGTKMRIPDDMYRAECDLVFASKTKIFSPDRSEFASRLIPLVAECWKESWELYHAATFGDRYRLKWWPVRIFAHRLPEVAYDLQEDGKLVAVPGGLSEDEARLLDF